MIDFSFTPSVINLGNQGGEPECRVVMDPVPDSWSWKSPFDWMVDDDSEEGGLFTFYVPVNTSKNTASVHVLYEAEDGEDLTEDYLPINVAGNPNSTVDYAIMVCSGSANIGSGSKSFVLPVYCSSSYNSSNFVASVDQNWVTITGISYSTKSYEDNPNRGTFIAYVTCSVTANSNENRFATFTFKNRSSSEGIQWVLNQEGPIWNAYISKSREYSSARSEMTDLPSLDVTYYGVEKAQIQAPSSSDSWLTVRLYSTSSTSPWKYNYGIRAEENSIFLPRTGSVTFKAISGSKVVSSSFRVEQEGQYVPEGDVIIDPSGPVPVDWSDTSNTFYVTYSNSELPELEFEILTPSGSQDVVITELGYRTVSNVSRIVSYSVAYPTNNLTSPVTRSVTFGMERPQDLITKTVDIYQGPKSSGPEPFIFVSGSPFTLESGFSSVEMTVIYSGSVREGYTVDTPGGTDRVRISVLNSSTDADSETIVYDVTFPANSTYDPIERYVWFRMHRGDDYKDGTGVIYQQGKPVPPTYDIVIPDPPTVSADTAQSNAQVQYIGALVSGVSILAPTLTGNASNCTEVSSYDSGVSSYKTYRVTLNPNSLYTPVTSSVTFKMQKPDSSVIEKTYYIYQQGKQTVFNPNIVPYPASPRTYAWYVSSSSVTVTYENAVSASYIQPAVAYNKISRITRTSVTQNGNDVVCTYDFELVPNDTVNPVTSSIEFRATSGSVSVASDYKIYQSPSGSSTFSIECPATRTITAPAQTGIVLGTVHYKGIDNQNQVYPENVLTPSQILSLDIIDSGSEEGGVYRQYGIRVKANTGDVPIESRIRWGIKDPGGSNVPAVTESTLVIQMPPASASVKVVPSSSTVLSTVTQSNLAVTYSGAQGYVVALPSMSIGVTASVLNSASVDGNWHYNYRITYPPNSAATAVTRSLNFSMWSGSVQKTGSAEIIQLPFQGQGIVVDPQATDIPYYGTVTRTTVIYSGITDPSLITAPSSTVSSWKATMAQVRVEAGQVAVEWEFRGDTNTGLDTRQILFTFNAVGIEGSGTFVINQYAFDEGTLVASGIIPAWKDTNTPVSDAEYVEAICRSADNVVLFDERMYRAPNKATLYVDFNRLVEGFLEPRDFTPFTKNVDVFSSTTTFRDSGLEYCYRYRVVDDWSYDSDIDVNTEYSLSRPYQDEVALGQYLVYSVLRTPSTTANTLKLRFNGVEIQETSPAEYYYCDAVKKINECGTWEVQSGVSILAKWKTIDAKYVLYYYNRYGGWDSFVIKGPVVPSVDIARSNYMNYRRNTRTYQNGVVEKFRVNTGILTDSVSPVVGELASSPRLVLHDIEKNVLTPVKVTTNSVEKKTFRNQGRQFARYEFDLEADLNQIRR